MSDVAQANALALAAEPRFGRCEPVNVCSGHPHTVGELATELLGYRARVGFAEGITSFATDPLREPVTT